MRSGLILGLAAWTLAFGATAAVPGPQRQLTAPKDVISLANPKAKPVAIQDLFDTRGAVGAALTPDGKTVVFSSNISGRFNIWKIAVGAGAPVQLAMSDQRQYDPVISPDGKWVVFQSDTGGNELFDLYAVPLEGGSVVNLTSSDDATETGPLFSPDGGLIAYSRKLKTAAQSDVWVLDPKTHQARALTHEASVNHQWAPVAFTRDGRFLIANRSDVNNTESSAWRIDVATGTAEKITPGDDRHLVGAADISPDGRLLAITSNLRGSQEQAGVLDLKTKMIRWAKPSPWEEGAEAFSPDGKTLLFSINADGRTSLNLFDLKSGISHALHFPAGVDSPEGRHPFAHDGRSILLGHQSANAPLDYWLAPTGQGRPIKVTHLAANSLESSLLPASSLVHYKSEDGTVISAILVTPFNLKRNRANPAIVIPHGGPTGQTTDTFSRTAQALASRGYVVIAPNVRGSTGYGKPFQDANIKDLGGGDLVDEVYAAKFLIATGYVDPKKIGITGGSYGGFMTLMAIGKTPDVWAAAVEEYGIINWFAMLEHEDPRLQQYERGLIGDPVKDKAVYDATSPMTYIKNARAPLLVLQGDNDIRVPKGQAEEVVATLKAAGGVVEAHYYAQEGHGFARRENQIDALQRTVDWFDKYLK